MPQPNYGAAQSIPDSILNNPIAHAILEMLGIHQQPPPVQQPANQLPPEWEKANQDSIQQMLHVEPKRAVQKR